MLAELQRRINNLVQFGEIHSSQSEEGKMLATAIVDGRVTDTLPVLSIGNPFKRHFLPMRTGEQVVVISPFGNGDYGFILRNIFSKMCKEPIGGDQNTEIIEYEDGARFSYNTQTKVLAFSTTGEVNIHATTLNVVGETNFTGGVNIEGALSVSKTITDEKGSVTSHAHSGVMAGGQVSGDRT